MKNQDHNTEARQEFIRNIPRETELQRRIDKRKAEMGTKYLCHPANRVKRLAVPLPR